MSFRRALLLSFGFWTCIGILTLPNEHEPLTIGLVTHTLSGVWLCVPLLPLMLMWLRRRGPTRSMINVAALQLPLGLVFGVVWGVVWEYTHVWEHPGQPYPKFGQALAHNLAYTEGVLFYLVSLALALALDYASRFRERDVTALRLEAELARAQVNALRMQLNPHFLFNTLNTVSALVERDPATTRVLIARLSELLRETLDGDEPEVPLSQELALLQRYIDIISIRFGDRMHCTIDADPDSLSVLVPPLLLQPLVENAVEHSAMSVERAVHIRIATQRSNGVVRVSVTDDGAGSRLPVTEGLGLRNVRQRLDTLYGGRAEVLWEDFSGGGFRASVVIPAVDGCGG